MNVRKVFTVNQKCFLITFGWWIIKQNQSVSCVTLTWSDFYMSSRSIQSMEQPPPRIDQLSGDEVTSPEPLLLDGTRRVGIWNRGVGGGREIRAVNQYNKAGVKAPSLSAYCVTGMHEEEGEPEEEEGLAHLC